MIGLVRTALAKPLTFIVMAVLIFGIGTLSIMRMPVDIFPRIGVPVIATAWTYNGLSPRDMAGRIVTPYERVLTSAVNNIQRIESQSLNGVAVVKIYFQPGVDIRTATAQVTSISQTILRQLPPGITPPMIVNYDASTVPILQLALSGEGLSEQQLFDLGLNQIRPQMVTVPGVAMPFPSGGKQRQMQIDVDPEALQARGLSAQDVADALAAQTQISPVGFAKIGDLQYNIRLNNAPASVDQLSSLPVKVVDGATIQMRDIAQVRDGSAQQINVVHVDGQRSALMTVLKSGSASTLTIVGAIKDRLPEVMGGLPDSLKITPIGDQSELVKAAVSSVVIEGALAALLTSLTILLFLGSWRSTIIIVTAIPLAILGSIAALGAVGHTLNLMTLSGLVLAIGILVDDATVTIENINWHLERGKGVIAAIMDGAAQIVKPALVALLSICIVFVPMFFLPGIAGYLFVPLALAVMFALITSFVLARTLVPTMAMYLLRPHAEGAETRPSRNVLVRFQRGFDRGFERMRARYGDVLSRVLGVRRKFAVLFLAGMAASLALVPLLGRDFFPAVDSGQIALHVRTPAGTRIEKSSATFARVQDRIREVIPPAEIESMVDNIGISLAPLNNIYANTGTVGPNEGDILITLAEGHEATDDYVRELRRELPLSFPGLNFAFLPADMTSQILNFGSPAPIDIQIRGRDIPANQQYAQKLLERLRQIPGLVDARIQQSTRYPQLNVDVDRTRIAQYGLNQRDVTASIGTALAGTAQSSPVFYLNPENGVSYPVVAQLPEREVSSVSDLAALPVAGKDGVVSQTLSGIGRITRSNTMSVVSKYNIQPVINIYATTQGRDLGAVAGDVNAAIASLEEDLPDASSATLRGQYETMNIAFSGLGFGLIAAIVLIYLVIVVNFQSWVDPLVIIGALPAALAGIAWMLFLTGTTLSVPALIGAIMAMGVSTANAILVVSFARERLAETDNAATAALEAGMVRLRPVLMTALVMIIGMTPMALGLGEGAEQNAPLGRAVIGGLLFATVATLFVVPALFSIAHRKGAPRTRTIELEPSHV
ncbi:efflux RND transporter permease subunit [Pacificimonas flava]|uniref:Cobalt-zinc-cadmium resistance protein CzcA n=1 Tax=Pacificimonas flava TaxID=1234595 RepID=M2U1Y9_9SPHN|nr:efflux RND transporter permease subunit [Pacificimonas flava]EMD81823.1 Cobalt-zinc-cadmium resistance protein CzcA [Pacificimonas flava]MBB5281647.1 CzcA family heavy metal efflux pump [Pacificimonas flava]